MKAIVFDLGGTLMEYTGMPSNWTSFYEAGFRSIAAGFSLSLTPAQLQSAIETLTYYNPRVNYREIEYPPEELFQKCLASWNLHDCPLSKAVDLFFEGMDLKPVVYPDSLPVLDQLHAAGYFIAALTDLPTGMPDRIFCRDILPLLERLDCYISSENCGYRKPNHAGLDQIASRAELPVSKLLYIGDEKKDQLTAKNAGCRFLKIDRNRQGHSDLSSLWELANML